MQAAPAMWDDLNAACVEAFREDEEIVLTVAGAPVPVPDAAFREPWTGDNLAGMPVERTAPIIELETRVWLALEGASATDALVRGIRYRITEVGADEAGMTRITLARWR